MKGGIVIEKRIIIIVFFALLAVVILLVYFGQRSAGLNGLYSGTLEATQAELSFQVAGRVLDLLWHLEAIRRVLDLLWHLEAIRDVHQILDALRKNATQETLTNRKYSKVFHIYEKLTERAIGNHLGDVVFNPEDDKTKERN
jgi:hypothetical protein